MHSGQGAPGDGSGMDPPWHAEHTPLVESQNVQRAPQAAAHRTTTEEQEKKTHKRARGEQEVKRYRRTTDEETCQRLRHRQEATGTLVLSLSLLTLNVQSMYLHACLSADADMKHGPTSRAYVRVVERNTNDAPAGDRASASQQGKRLVQYLNRQSCLAAHKSPQHSLHGDRRRQRDSRVEQRDSHCISRVRNTTSARKEGTRHEP